MEMLVIWDAIAPIMTPLQEDVILIRYVAQ